MKYLRTGVISAAIALGLVSFSTTAKAEFPDKPVTVVVGFGAGGGVDTISRAASSALTKSLGQPIVVQNRPGAGGGLAVTALKSEAADGYTIVATTSTTLTFDPHAKDIGFGIDDFEYIAAFGVFPEALVALPSRGWKTFADAIAEARKSGGLTYASTTSIDRVVLAAIAKKEGVKISPVPTKGGAEAVAQTLGGHVDFAYSSGTYYAQAKAGKLSVLAALGDKRVVGFEDAPTLRELGYDASSVNMILFLTPKGLPAAVKAKLVAAFKAAATDKTLLDVLAKRNMGNVVLVGSDIESAVHEQSKQFKAALSSN
ncbi:MAG: tripartite tricarboxylate transporter substrate binding protein [Rhodospirillales bacterium]|jgi:tripartite-type tricarboxylate transporter receptor subunit TctC|nr:tripartite tricarboxylate transporter substrate binding protein [Rhodospirillales bacterium]